MTLPTIHSANRIVFLVDAARRRPTPSRARSAASRRHDVPASLARLAPVPVEVFLDEAAASKLTRMSAPRAPARRRVDVLEIDRPEQLKALGHPLRLKVLQVLGESDEPLTNRELAARLVGRPRPPALPRADAAPRGADRAAPAEGREKPYRPVAKHFKVGPEIRATGLASELQAAQLRELQRGFDLFAANGEFRSAQVHAKLDVETRARRSLNELSRS